MSNPVCVDCGADISARKKGARYCVPCAKKRRAQSNKANVQRFRAKQRMGQEGERVAEFLQGRLEHEDRAAIKVGKFTLLIKADAVEVMGESLGSLEISMAIDGGSFIEVYEFVEGRRSGP